MSDLLEGLSLKQQYERAGYLPFDAGVLLMVDIMVDRITALEREVQRLVDEKEKQCRCRLIEMSGIPTL